MKLKTFLILSTLLVFSLLTSACSSTVYSSTGWFGLTASSDTAYLAAGGFVYSINLNTHNQNWKYPEKANSKGFYANPVLTSDGQLLVPGYDHILYSLNPSNNGSLNWTFSGSSNRLIASPLVIQNVIFQPSSDGYVYAIDLTGKELWKQTTGGPIWAEPATDGNCGCIYIASMDHKVYKFDASTGRALATTADLGGSIVGTPFVGSDGTVYVGTFGKELLALDGTSLNVKWRFATHNWVWSGPAFANNVLYFGDLSGYFYALNSESGTAVFPALQVNSPLVDTPLVTADKTYFTAESDTLYIVDSSGSLSSKAVGGQIYTAPVQAGNIILLTPSGFTSQLVAVGTDGTQQWVFPPPKS